MRSQHVQLSRRAIRVRSLWHALSAARRITPSVFARRRSGRLAITSLMRFVQLSINEPLINYGEHRYPNSPQRNDH